MKDYSQPKIKDYSQPKVKDYSQPKEDPSLARQIFLESDGIGDLVLGGLETIGSGIGAVVGTAAEGLTLLAGGSRETAGNVKEALTPVPFSPVGIPMAEAVSAPFEWYDKEGTRVGDTDREGMAWLLQDGLGMDKETAEVAANVFGTMTETSIRAIPYVLGLKAPAKAEPAAPRPYTPAEIVSLKNETKTVDKGTLVNKGPEFREKVVEPELNTDIRPPQLDYTKLQEAAKAEDTIRSVAKEIDSHIPRNPSTYVVDERPLHEIKPELYDVRTEKNIKFGTGATEELTRVYTPRAKDLPDRYGEGGRLIPGRGQYISGTFVGVIKHNPILKWVTSQGRREDLYIKSQFHETMFGTDVKMVRGKPTYQSTDRGWVTKFSKLPLDQRAEVIRLRDLLDDSSMTERPSRELLEGYGLSKEAIDFFYHDMDVLSKTVDRVNVTIKQLQKLGYNLTEFPKYDRYNPHLWTGDFRTFVKDKQGNIITTVDNETIVGQKLSEKKLKEQFGDKYEISSISRLDKTNDLSVEAINDMISKSSYTFPEQAAEIKAFLEAQKDIKGMSVHSLERKGARGFLGDPTKGLNPVKLSEEFQKSRETFVHGMLRKEASLRLRFNLDQLRQDPVLKKLYPNSIKYSERMIDDFIGKKTLADEIISKLTYKFLGQSGVNKAVGGLSSAMTYPLLLLGSIPNIAVQPFQIGYGVIKSIGMRNELGLSAGEVHGAWAKGMLDMLPGKSPEIRDVALTAGKRGAVSPEFIQFMHEADSLQGRPLENKSLLRDTLSGKLAYSMPDEYSRLAQVFGFYETLKAAGKSHEVAKLDAIELSKQYSVPYNNLERPAAYRGTVGAVIGKFQTWSSNQYAQFLEHLDTANRGDLAPLATFLAYSATISGLFGFWGIQEADKVVEMVNKKFQTNHPLPSMSIAEVAPDWLAYGPIQSNLDYTVGTTNVPSFNRRLTSFPLIDFYSEVWESTTNLMAKKMGFGSPPDKMDIERFLLSFAARSMHGPLKMYIERGDISPLEEGETQLMHDPKKGKGTYRVDRDTQIVNYLGGKTMDQHKMSLVHRWIQSVEDNRKLTVKDWATYVAISSSMGVKVDLSKFKEEVAREFKITPDEFNKAVRAAADGFNTSMEERDFAVNTRKGRRAGSEFYEIIERDKIKDYSKPKDYSEP